MIPVASKHFKNIFKMFKNHQNIIFNPNHIYATKKIVISAVLNLVDMLNELLTVYSETSETIINKKAKESSSEGYVKITGEFNASAAIKA